MFIRANQFCASSRKLRNKEQKGNERYELVAEEAFLVKTLKGKTLGHEENDWWHKITPHFSYARNLDM